MNFLSTFQAHKWDRYALGLGAVLVLVLAVLPLAIDNSYVTGLVFTTLMFVTLASSWNLLSGYTGYISFGHVAFFGIGGYTCAVLIADFGMNLYLAILAGGIVTAIVSLPVALATIRLSGVYFSIIMLAFAELLLEVAINLDITGGSTGKVLPVNDNELLTYYLMLGLMVVTLGVVYLSVRSYFGLTLTAIHDDEEAAESLGLNTTYYKVVAFSLSAVFPALAGGIAAVYWLFINPSTMFAVTTSGDMMIMSVIGGMGTILGPIIGATMMTPIRSQTQAVYPFLNGIVFGLLFMILVLTVPNGLVSLTEKFDQVERLVGWFNDNDRVAQKETDD